MIESYAYQIIKDEGFVEGEIKGEIKRAKEYIVDALNIRFGTMPLDIIEKIEEINDLSFLNSLHRNAITVTGLDVFKELLKEVHS